MSSTLSEDKLTNWFIFQNNRLLLVKDADTAKPLTNSELSTLKPHFLRQLYLGLYHNTECYCAEIAADFSVPENIIVVPLRQAFELLGGEWFAVTAKAFSVLNWDKTHQFCGCCGNKTSHNPGTFERICKTCGLTFYPRISPSMIVLIKKGEHVLMARGHHFPPGRYGLVAGFVEVGESIEDAVHREVREEVGIEIKNLSYFGSQSWPFPDSLMIGFIADYSSGDIKIDYNEIEAADWYHFENLPGRPLSISIAGKLIDHFILEIKKSIENK